MGVTIMTDSTCDMSSSQAREHGVEVVPIWIRFGSERLRDGIDITRTNFYERLATAKDLPRTEPPDTAAFEAAFAEAVDAGNEVVAPVVSMALSETFKNAAAAAAKFGSKVRVWDSKTVSGGLFLQAMVAGDMAKAGASAADIIVVLEHGRGVQHGYLISPDLTYLGRSGRVNKAIVALGTMMKVSPDFGSEEWRRRIRGAGAFVGEGAGTARRYGRAQHARRYEDALRRRPHPRARTCREHCGDAEDTSSISRRSRLTSSKAAPRLRSTAAPGARPCSLPPACRPSSTACSASTSTCRFARTSARTAISRNGPRARRRRAGIWTRSIASSAANRKRRLQRSSLAAGPPMRTMRHRSRGS